MSQEMVSEPTSVAQPSAPSKKTPRTRRFLDRLLVASATVALWWLLTAVVFADNPVVSKMGPWATVTELVALLGDPQFLDAITVSLSRLLAGLSIAVLLGVPLGLLLGSRQGIDNATSPVVNFLRMTSPLSWAPLVVVLLGSGSGAVIALIALAAVWPVILGVSAGVRAIDPGLSRVARALGATGWERLRSIVFPALATPITGAVRVALGISWVILVPAEMFGVANGLGYAILNARDNVDYTALAATMLAIGALGFLLDRIFRGLHDLARGR